MRSGKWYLLHTILLTVVVGGLLGTGCKKYDGVLNNNAIRTPYTLYFADKLGALYNTNDAKAYKIVIPADGVAERALLTSGNNILFVKYNFILNKLNGVVAVSSNNGVNWNPKNISTNPIAVWQNQILDVPSHDLIYLASTKTNSVEISPDHGLTWNTDATWGPLSGVNVQSFTQLKDGKLYGLDYLTQQLYEKATNVSNWLLITAAEPLPAGRFQLAHFNNTLVAADLDGINGVWYSNNNGVNWIKYVGIPDGHEIYYAASPHDRVLLVGLDSVGVYRLEGNQFKPSNNGLETSTSVYGIVGKEDIYKNDIIKQYVYLATSLGLYRSEDMGQNWVLMRAGDFRTIY